MKISRRGVFGWLAAAPFAIKAALAGGVPETAEPASINRSTPVPAVGWQVIAHRAPDGIIWAYITAPDDEACRALAARNLTDLYPGVVWEVVQTGPVGTESVRHTLRSIHWSPACES